MQLNVVGTLLFCAVSGYCFLFSCFARDERTALGLSATLTVLFYGLHAVGTLSQRFSWMSRLSLFTVFNPQNLMHGHGHFAAASMSLAALTVALFGVAIAVFRRRQLAL